MGILKESMKNRSEQRPGKAATDSSAQRLIRDIDGWAVANAGLSKENLSVLLVFVCL